MKAIILAAGMGTRLGSLIPKPLTALKDEKTILDYQVEKLAETVGLHNIIMVVGYKHHVIMEKFPELIYIYNHEYTQTNTSKSLLYALNKIEGEDVIWMNGDVFFDKEVISLISASDRSSCLVDNKKCAEEEIKYNLDEEGFIKEISKQVVDAKGEALGINLVKASDIQKLREALDKVENSDYFEKALENLTLGGHLKLRPIDVGDLFCQEIDFQEDLDLVQEYMNSKK